MTQRATMERVAAVNLLMALLLCCLPAAAKQHHKRAAREQIEALEEQWRVAQLGEDVATMDKLLSDDYLGITSAGQVVTKVQQLDRMRTRSLDLRELEISDVKIKLLGNIAIVTSLADLDGVSNGKPIQGSFRYTHVFQRLPSGSWKITNFEATRVPKGRRNLLPDETH